MERRAFLLTSLIPILRRSGLAMAPPIDPRQTFVLPDRPGMKHNGETPHRATTSRPASNAAPSNPDAATSAVNPLAAYIMAITINW
jgi:hypothetical protein